MRRIFGSLWAGSISAAICYTEYMGLGAMLGTALLGYGAQSQTMGGLLVILAAAISSLVLCARKLPLIAGPRGASLSILVLGLVALQSYFPGSSSDQIALLVATMLGCVVMLFLGTFSWVSWIFKQVPTWLVPAFMYASALSIVANASKQYVFNCLQVNEIQSIGIFFGGVAAGLMWLAAFRKLAERCKNNPKAAGLARSFAGTTLIVGAGVAWGLYELSSLPNASAGMCARIGNLSLNLDMVLSRTQSLMAYEWRSLSVMSVGFSLFWGMLVGAVVILETRSSIDVLAKQLKIDPTADSHPLHKPIMKWNARYQALLLPAATVASSISQSRSQILWNLYKPDPLAVFMHSAALLVIAFYASHLLANLPQIALAVLMTLVACTMIMPQLETEWGGAYSLKTSSISAGLGFWVVIGITVSFEMALLGFIIPAALSILARSIKKKATST